jgi:hypothetical protein
MCGQLLTSSMPIVYPLPVLLNNGVPVVRLSKGWSWTWRTQTRPKCPCPGPDTGGPGPK